MRKFTLAWMLLAGAATVWAQDDPPSRVARLNWLEGSVSFQGAGRDDWSAAVPNYPLTVGDHLWADENAHAELHIGSTAIRLDSHTALAFLNLDDRMAQMRLSDGTINISVRHLEGDDSYEVDTPNGAVTLLRSGKYRIDADPERQTTTVTVRSGEAEVTSGGQAFPVHPRQSAFITGADTPNTEVSAAQRPDDFDHWWEERDQREERRPAPRYVSQNMAGYEDLEDNGSWRDYPGYGPVWTPRVVVAGWAPYHYGHWAFVEPWGWTWIDDAPWGFAPFHYGRWAYIGGSWGWCPGAIVARPVYAPALVAWVGGNHWGVSLSFGGGGGVGWFPLGPREVYVPSYRVSNNYVTRVNVTNVTNVTNITNVTNVTNVHYVNQNVPGAVTAVSRTDFAASRPVGRVAVAVPPSAVASATVSTQATPVPREQALAARPVNNMSVARPPQTALNAPVVTKTPPPAATQSLARPANVQAYRPAAVNQPTPPTPSYRPPTGQVQPQSTPAYKPPTGQVQPQSTQEYKPPTGQTQPPPAYKPPTGQTQTQPPPAYRPPTGQVQPQSTPAYKPPTAQGQVRTQSEPSPHYHGAPPSGSQGTPAPHPSEKPKAESRPKEKSKEK